MFPDPIDIHLNGCGIEVGDLPANGGKFVVFQHQTGVVRFTASLPPDGVKALVRGLTGLSIAQSMPAAGS